MTWADMENRRENLGEGRGGYGGRLEFCTSCCTPFTLLLLSLTAFLLTFTPPLPMLWRKGRKVMVEKEACLASAASPRACTLLARSCAWRRLPVQAQA